MALSGESLGPYLYVNVLGTSITAAIGYSYTVEVEFFQLATLQANGQQQLVATWVMTGVGIWNSTAPRASDLAHHAIRDRISDFVDTFSNDYLTVNPQP